MGIHQARKRFGQNFLVDLSVIDQIVRVIDPNALDRVLEIGPGQAALTAPLLARLNHLTVIEIDRDLAQRLRNRFPDTQLTVLEADVLNVDFSPLGSSLRVVGNLPYNISSPLLFKLIDYADQIKDQHFMLQKEVVDRMVAVPGDPHYSRLSVMLQARYAMTRFSNCKNGAAAARSFAPSRRRHVFGIGCTGFWSAQKNAAAQFG